MYFKSLFLLFSLCLTELSATEICIASSPCKCVMNGGAVIDLSSVGSADFPRFYEISFEGSLYSYNPCYPFDSPDKHAIVKKGSKPCINAAGCMKTPGDNEGHPPEEHAIGLANDFKFDSVVDGTYINYTVPGAEENLAVKLVCDETIPYRLTIDPPETNDSSTVTMTLRSKCACPNGCRSSIEPESKGLSTGSKLLIAFFTILLAYFIIGMVWNFCNGAKGMELMPNLDFWNELPKLIIEGVAFSCSCFGRKSSYGEV